MLLENMVLSDKKKEFGEKIIKNESKDKNQINAKISNKEDILKINYKISFCSSNFFD